VRTGNVKIPQRTRGYLAIVIAAVLFGVWPSLSKRVLTEVHPFVVALLIQLIPAIALSPSLRRLRIARADWPLLALSGVVGAVAAAVCWGTSNTASAVLLRRIPIFPLLEVQLIFGTVSFAVLVPLSGAPLAVPSDILPDLLLLAASAVGMFSVLFFYAFRTIGAMRTGAILPTSALWGILAAFYFFPNQTLSVVQVVGGALMVGSLVVFYLFRGPTETRAAGETLKPEASDGPDSP